MVEDRITDGKRIAELLSSEVDARGADLAALSVTNANRDAEGTADGQRAYDVDRDGERIARVYVHEDRVRIDVERAPDRAVELAEEYGLRARPKAVDPPRTLVFVESGAAVKRASDLLGDV